MLLLYGFVLKEIFAKKWDCSTECIDATYTFSAEEMERFESNRQELDQFLGAYPYEEYKRWLSLTNNITDMKFFEKLLPESGLISSGSDLVGKEFHSKKGKDSTDKNVEAFEAPTSLADAEQRLPEMTCKAGTNLRFTKIPLNYLPTDSKPSDVTYHSIDMTYKFRKLLELQQLTSATRPNEFNLMSELQFAFVCFLIGQNYDAFEQWKSLLQLLCNCEQAIVEYHSFYLEFVNVLYFQLKEMPQDFFVDILSRNNFLLVNLHNFFDNINEVSSQDMTLMKKLHEKSNKFKNYVTQRFGIDFEETPDEYAPVVCQE